MRRRISYFLMIVFCAASVLAMAQNNTPSVPPEPANLAEAAGRYIAAVEQLNVLKATQCGYALKRKLPSFDEVSANEIQPAFPAQSRSEVAQSLSQLKKGANEQAKKTFDSLYYYYTQTEMQDNNTACGFITGAFIGVRKMAFEAFDRARAKR